MIDKIMAILKGDKKKLMPKGLRAEKESPEEDLLDSPEHEAMETPEEEKAEHEGYDMSKTPAHKRLAMEEEQLSDDSDEESDEGDNHEEYEQADADEEENRRKGKLYGDGHKRAMTTIILSLGGLNGRKERSHRA